jgi:predicted RNA polymerase sigma factor
VVATPELDRVFRERWGYVLAALIGYLGDFDLAEDAAQEAFAIAAERWPRDGVPASPRSHVGGEDPPAPGAAGSGGRDGLDDLP